MPVNILRLTKAEEKLFRALPDAVRDGWQVEEETLTYDDKPENRILRLQFINFTSPPMVAFAQKARAAKSKEALAALVESELNIASMSNDDLGQLFYALGPDVVTQLITEILRVAKDDEAILTVASLGKIRHVLLKNFTAINA